VSYFASDLSWVESGASGAVTASFVRQRLAARAARAVADGGSENFGQLRLVICGNGCLPSVLR
jgi:hypothetical protein